jgi:hypothetical protein
MLQMSWDTIQETLALLFPPGATQATLADLQSLSAVFPLGLSLGRPSDEVASFAEYEARRAAVAVDAAAVATGATPRVEASAAARGQADVVNVATGAPQHPGFEVASFAESEARRADAAGVATGATPRVEASAAARGQADVANVATGAPLHPGLEVASFVESEDHRATATFDAAGVATSATTCVEANGLPSCTPLLKTGLAHSSLSDGQQDAPGKAVGLPGDGAVATGQAAAAGVTTDPSPSATILAHPAPNDRQPDAPGCTVSSLRDAAAAAGGAPAAGLANPGPNEEQPHAPGGVADPLTDVAPLSEIAAVEGGGLDELMIRLNDPPRHLTVVAAARSKKRSVQGSDKVSVKASVEGALKGSARRAPRQWRAAGTACERAQPDRGGKESREALTAQEALGMHSLEASTGSPSKKGASRSRRAKSVVPEDTVSQRDTAPSKARARGRCLKAQAADKAEGTVSQHVEEPAQSKSVRCKRARIEADMAAQPSHACSKRQGQIRVGDTVSEVPEEDAEDADFPDAVNGVPDAGKRVPGAAPENRDVDFPNAVNDVPDAVTDILEADVPLAMKCLSAEGQKEVAGVVAQPDRAAALKAASAKPGAGTLAAGREAFFRRCVAQAVSLLQMSWLATHEQGVAGCGVQSNWRQKRTLVDTLEDVLPVPCDRQEAAYGGASDSQREGACVEVVDAAAAATPDDAGSAAVAGVAAGAAAARVVGARKRESGNVPPISFPIECAEQMDANGAAPPRTAIAAREAAERGTKGGQHKGRTSEPSCSIWAEKVAAGLLLDGGSWHTGFPLSSLTVEDVCQATQALFDRWGSQHDGEFTFVSPFLAFLVHDLRFSFVPPRVNISALQRLGRSTS